MVDEDAGRYGCDGLGGTTGRAAVDEWLQGCEKAPGWVAPWHELMDEREPVVGPDGEPVLNGRGHARVRSRWSWQQAAYIAWMATPKRERQPETLEELAHLLGYTGAVTFRNWRQRRPEIVERIHALPKVLLAGHLADVYDALVQVATSPDYRAHQDRQLFLELTGEYAPKGINVSANAEANVELGARFEEALRRAYGDADEESMQGAALGRAVSG